MTDTTRLPRAGDIVRHRTSLPIPETLRVVTTGSNRFPRPDHPDHLELRAPGGISYARPADVSIVCAGDAILERIDRAASSTMTHVAECPTCQEIGCHAYTLAGWDRLWCRSCGHVWDVLAALIDEADLSTCTECESALLPERTECEWCSTDWAHGERSTTRGVR